MKTIRFCRISVAVPALVLSLLASACSGTSEPRPSGQATTTTTVVDQPVSGGAMVIGLSRSPGILNPAITADFDVHVASEPMFNGLVALTVGNVPVSELAESWTVDDGGRTYRFKLRSGVKWHDGQPFTSDDVRFTFEEVLLKHHPRTGPSLTAAGLRIDTPDSATAVFSFPAPYAILLQQLNVTEAPILPRHVYGTCTDVATETGCPANLSPVGTGPFKWSSRSTDEIRLVRNAEYFRPGQPYLDELVQRVIPDPAAQVTALRARQVDWLWTTPDADLPNLRVETDNLLVTDFARDPGGGNCMSTVAFNVDPPDGRTSLIGEVRVRQALWASAERDGTTPEIASGAAIIASQPIHTRVSVARAIGLDLPPFDVPRAELLLTSVGWKAEGGGARVARGVAGVADGTRLRLEAHAAGPRELVYAQGLAEYWRDVGVELVVTDDGPILSPKVYRDRQFDLAFLRYCAQVDPVLGVKAQYESDSIGTSPLGNIAGYSQPEMDQLWARVTAEVDPAVRQQLFQRIQELAVRDLPYIWLAEFSNVLGWNRQCSGFNFGNTGLFVETAYCQRDP